MAVTYQSSNTSGWVTAADPVVTKPASLGVGDLMIGVVGCNNADQSFLGLPSGFTTISSGNGGATAISALWGYKVADAGDVAATNFTFEASDYSLAVADLIRITGASTTGIVSSSAAGVGTTTIVCANTITPAANSLILMNAWGKQDSNATRTISAYAVVTNNPSWTEIIDTSTATDEDGGHGVAYANRPEATATGNSSWTWSGTYSFSFGVMISIPQISGPTTINNLNGVTASTIASYDGVTWTTIDSINGAT